ncbi:hypothetical protein BDY24DRAFT_377761 [Mrakia frigida]|uniref:uncharacterized protein n=1 Tax=Mrakia frigida TaxID=29902 RepID=UPI003FCBFFCA
MQRERTITDRVEQTRTLRLTRGRRTEREELLWKGRRGRQGRGRRLRVSCRLKGEGGEEREGEKERAGADGGTFLCSFPHLDDDEAAKKSRRKSGGEAKEDGKLTKRKEQNRAAQRAFRERKEKHVKDLEDKVTALLVATEGQKSENENLRDLLARLQQENVLLKQSAFTFSFSDKVGGSGTSVPVNAIKPLSPPEEKDADSPQSFVSGSSPHTSISNSVSPNTTSSGDSPSSIFNTVSNPDTPPTQPGQGFSSSGFNAFSAPSINDLHIPGSSSRSNSNTSQQKPMQESSMGGFSPSFLDSNGGPLDVPSPPSFAFSPTAFFPSDDQATSPSSFQLLASNPSYTSFRDPQSLDAQMDFFANPSLSPSSNELFGGQAQFDGSQFDDFFLHGMMPTFTTPAFESNNPLSPTASTMASLLNDSPQNDSPQNNSNSQDASPSSTVSSEASPISYGPEEAKLMLEYNISSAEYEEMKRTGNYSSCPKDHSKEALDEIIKSSSPATFGPPVPVASGSGSGSSSLAAAESSKYAMLSGPSASAAMEAEAKRQSVPWDPENHQKFFEGKIFLAADPKAKNMRLDQVWNKIMTVPGFIPENFDLEGLCDEFKCKAKCDGSGAVLDENQVQQLLDEIPYRMKKP